MSKRLAVTATTVMLTSALASFALAGTVTQTNLVSDGAIPAAHTDLKLKNAWGISYFGTGAFWVSDNGTGFTTLYNGTGTPQSLVVTIPKPGGGTSAPTGQVSNGTGAFKVTARGKSGSPFFIFATEDGTISGWSPSVNGTNAILAVDESGERAVYKGLALYSTTHGNFLLATNFRSGLVEVYDDSYHLVHRFRDNGTRHSQPIPPSYSPFNVAVLKGHIFVTYAKTLPGRHDDEAGAGHGYVDEVALDGRLIRRIASQGALNSPWGLAIAPSSFGPLAGRLLVGNFGDGHVSAFTISTSKFDGQLTTSAGMPLAIDGLWALIPGNGGGASGGGDTNTIYFSAGPNQEADGLFGKLTFTP